MRRLKPAVLKVKNIGRDGKTSIFSIPLRVDTQTRSSQLSIPVVGENENVAEQDVPLCEDDDLSATPSATAHEKRVLNISENWGKVQDSMLSSYIEERHLPENSQCVNCFDNATTRCEYCGPRQYFCLDCAKSLHAKRSKFHVLEIWKDGLFFPLYPDDSVVGYGHVCGTKTTKLFRLLDASGNHHLKYVEVCQCESQAVTLLKCQFWPGSPVNPTTGFSIKLMEFAVKVFLHCQVSLLSFTEVISELNPQLQSVHVNSIYSILNSDCFEQFRHFMYEYRHLTKYVNELYNGAICPLCPTSDSSVLIESMDGCFGLCRKQKKGNILGTPKHGTILFADQDDVDNFVNSYGKAGADTQQNCSKFHAGEVLAALRSKGKNKLFDEKGVFGRVCRHDFPKGFHNIKHGERISYSVYELKKLKNSSGPNSKLIVMYDIACLLSNHLKCSSQENLLAGVDLAIPIFHCYGHKASCQIQYSPRRIEGIGLTDGEGVERLWSFLRKFSCITKEMSAHKRTDVLTDGLLHYGQHLYHKFGVTLKAKFSRANTLMNDVDQKLRSLIDKLPVKCDNEKIQEWRNEELENLKPKERGLVLQWDESYVSLLLMAKKLKNELTCFEEEGQDKAKDIAKKIKRNEKALNTLERKYEIRERWSISSPVFLSVKKRLNEKRKSELLLELHCMASERCFLVELKRKYADGQAVAIKLSKQIEKVVKSMKKTLLEANETLHDDEPPITYEDAKDPMNSLYSATAVQSTNVLPASLKRRIIDWSCFKARCEEEICMIKEEMTRFFTFITEQMRVIDESVGNFIAHCDIPINTGLIACLKQKRVLYSNQVSNLVRLWAGILDTTHIQIEEVKSYESFSGENHSATEGPCLDEENNFILTELDDEEQSFVLELSSDSDLSDDE